MSRDNGRTTESYSAPLGQVPGGRHYHQSDCSESVLFVFIAFERLHEREIRPSEGVHEGVSRLSESFDSASWKASLTSDSLDPIRLRMVDDFLNRYRLRGMTREEVVSLLGTPRETNYSNYFRDYDLVYWLGSEGGSLSLNSEWLLAIKFSGNGRVSKTALVRE